MLARISHHADGLWFFGALTGLCKGGIEVEGYKRVTATLAKAWRGGFRVIDAGAGAAIPQQNSTCTLRRNCRAGQHCRGSERTAIRLAYTCWKMP